jgi:hypothetical protein
MKSIIILLSKLNTNIYIVVFRDTLNGYLEYYCLFSNYFKENANSEKL